jgi:serine/threonine-protein kinase HipA
MASNRIINVSLFGNEIGRIGLDEDQMRSSFQYNPAFLANNTLLNIFPTTGIIKRTEHVQLYSQFNNGTFKGIPPQFADSLPDLFGSIIFKAWLECKNQQTISVLEQLAYVGNRGMGALEYSPAIKIQENTSINLDKIIEVVQEILDLTRTTAEKSLDHQALLNIFKIGTSAGGARPKILISEEKETGKIIPGDLETSDEYNHYLVKLALDGKTNYPREVVEFCYYQIAKKAGIQMMDSKLIDDKHFATLRFDRQDGEKKHVLTASGLTGWDYKSSKESSYENLFKLCSFLKIPHAQTEELFKRMIFNVVYGNTDDHLKNHSFIYNKQEDTWQLAPAYDLTYALNPLLNFTNTKRALSINGKRNDIKLKDIYQLADDFTIKNPDGIVRKVLSYRGELKGLFEKYNVPNAVSRKIDETIVELI